MKDNMAASSMRPTPRRFPPWPSTQEERGLSVCGTCISTSMAALLSAVGCLNPRPSSVMERGKLLRRRSSSVGRCLSSRGKTARAPCVAVEKVGGSIPRRGSVNACTWRTCPRHFRIGSASCARNLLPVEYRWETTSRSSSPSLSPRSTTSCLDLQAMARIEGQELQALLEALKMASGGTLAMDKSLPGKMEGLKVRGTAISPGPGAGATDDLTVPAQASDLGMTSQLSSAASGEDDDDLRSMTSGDAYNVLQSVVHVNQTLENQISALRLRLDVEAKQHRSEKTELASAKNKLIEDKEKEMDDLKDSLAAREERISVLIQSSEEKDRQIGEKMAEIEGLRQLVERTENYAKELGRQVTRLKVEKRHLESDAIYREQNQEIARLKKELQLLRERLSSMETELKRAHRIIEQQNSRITELDTDKMSMHAKFKDELDKASRAMRQEVERMREVMKQNYEEIRNLREQNHEMHDDVREIKDMLLKGKTPRPEPMKPTATTDINLSRYVTVRPPARSNRAQSPDKAASHLNRRSLEQLSVNMQRNPRYPHSPSVSPTRGSPSRGHPRPPGSSVSRGSQQSGAGLPPIASMKDPQGSRWVPAGRAHTNLSSATSRGTDNRK